MIVALIIIGALLIVWGGASFLAGAMSDAPAAGESAGRDGIMTLLAGLVMIIIAVVMYVSGARS